MLSDAVPPQSPSASIGWQSHPSAQPVPVASAPESEKEASQRIKFDFTCADDPPAGDVEQSSLGKLSAQESQEEE